MFCSTSIENGVAFLVGASGVGNASGASRIYTWSVEGATCSGLLEAWAVVVGFSFMGIG